MVSAHNFILLWVCIEDDIIMTSQKSPLELKTKFLTKFPAHKIMKTFVTHAPGSLERFNVIKGEAEL